MASHPMIGTRVPPSVMEQIKKDIADGECLNVSDWVRMACIEYAKKRKRELLGGGVLTDLGCIAKKKLPFWFVKYGSGNH